MCGGGGGGGGDGGAEEREKKRQKNIQRGYAKIKSIFDPHTSVYGNGDVDMSTLDTTGGTTYYTEGGEIWQPYSETAPQKVLKDKYKNSSLVKAMAAKGNLADTYYKTVPGKKVANALPGKLFAGVATKEEGGFGDEFFNQRQQDYVDYAKPQVDDQYNSAYKKLIYALSSAGRLNSQTRGDKMSDLQKEYDKENIAVVDKGRNYANQARSAVDAARSDLVNMNAALADPAQIASEAQSRVAALQAAPQFDSVAPLFTNVAEGLATQADLERRNSARYSTGLFTPATSGSGSQRIIR